MCPDRTVTHLPGCTSRGAGGCLALLLGKLFRGGRGAVLAEGVARDKNHEQDDGYKSDGLRRLHDYLSLGSSLPPPCESVSAILHTRSSFTSDLRVVAGVDPH